MYKLPSTILRNKPIDYLRIKGFVRQSFLHSKAEETIVEIKYGKLKGRVADDYKGGRYFSFQGIPYAKPPIGEHRFKSPLPPEKWQGIKDATQLGNISLAQHMVDREKVVGSEDCLYLNVYTPNIPKSSENLSLKPVMFWIHAGGFLFGSGNPEFYGPEHLITGDVVIVTINYRLGMLGFLSLEDPSLGVPGNAGLKDMVKALKWVKENIQHFGGDPKNVTIFGESAGGSSVQLLMCSPMAKGLFHRAIIQSGSAYNPGVWSRRISQELCRILKLDTTNEKDLLNYLYKVPSKEFVKIQFVVAAELVKSLAKIDVMQTFRVVTEMPSPSEMNFLTQHPWEIFSSGNYNKVPLMIGYANREGMLTEIEEKMATGSFQVPKDLTTRIPYMYNIPKGSELSKDITHKIKNFYFGDKEPSNETIDEFLKLETDVLIYRGVFVSMRQFSSNLNAPIYMYRFSANTRLNALKNIGQIKRAGTCHSDIVGYLFTTHYTPKFTPESLEGIIVDMLITMWTNFAKTSNPNTDKLQVSWEPVTKDCYNYLDIGNSIVPGKNPDGDRMAFWDNIASDPAIKSNF